MDLGGRAAREPGHHRALGLEEGHWHRILAVGGLQGAGGRVDPSGYLPQPEDGGVHVEQPAVVVDVVAQLLPGRHDLRLADGPVVDVEPLTRRLVAPLLLGLEPSHRGTPLGV
ncbi:hypothetical protein [Streptomyces goshikiensis]|uniref:hypothetical protein n=1 Tax=Streptomyces goshikiensis TaxID=1942 RepID=UPI002AE01919|nr:hypothetical protein [Streptomyces goshikiensis]